MSHESSGESILIFIFFSFSNNIVKKKKNTRVPRSKTTGLQAPCRNCSLIAEAYLPSEFSFCSESDDKNYIIFFNLYFVFPI